MKKITKFFLLVAVTAGLTSCGNKAETWDEKQSGLKIVTTFYPMYDFTEKLVGEAGTVKLLIDGATEPHDFEPSAKDVALIQEADLFVYHSQEMEAWVGGVLDSLDRSKTMVVEASEGLPLLASQGEEGHGHSQVADPHMWLDPVLAQEEVKKIEAALSEVDPVNEQRYAEASSLFIKQLKALDEAYSQTLAGASKRELVTQHAAFGYLAARYQLHQVAISGISPEQEPTPAELAKIEAFVVKNNVQVIYTEELSSPKISETIAQATGAQLVTLNTLEGLSSEAQAQGADYLSVMAENLAALSIAIK